MVPAGWLHFVSLVVEQIIKRGDYNLYKLFWSITSILTVEVISSVVKGNFQACQLAPVTCFMLSYAWILCSTCETMHNEYGLIFFIKE